MTDTTLHTIRRSRGRVSLLDLLLTHIRLRRSRRNLLALDARLLDDVGISRADALAEAGRPIWDVPRHWLQ